VGGFDYLQIKDIALKVSGAYKCKSSTPTSTYRKGHRPYPDFDTISEGVPYPFQPGSSSSTPAWEFTRNGHHRTPMTVPKFASGFLGMDSVPQSGEVVVEDDSAPKEWTAQVEPGVQITFVSLPRGGNDLKRIRFRYNLSLNMFSEEDLVMPYLRFDFLAMLDLKPGYVQQMASPEMVGREL